MRQHKRGQHDHARGCVCVCVCVCVCGVDVPACCLASSMHTTITLRGMLRVHTTTVRRASPLFAGAVGWRLYPRRVTECSMCFRCYVRKTSCSPLQVRTQSPGALPVAPNSRSIFHTTCGPQPLPPYTPLWSFCCDNRSGWCGSVLVPSTYLKALHYF